MNTLETSMEDHAFIMKVNERIHDLSTHMDDVLKRKVQEAIRSQKSNNLGDHDIKEMFESLWSEATGDILRMARRVVKDEDIESAVQGTILSLLGTDDHLYRQILSSPHPKKGRHRHKSSCGKSYFKVDRKTHLRLKRLGAILRVNDEDVYRLQVATDKITTEARK